MSLSIFCLIDNKLQAPFLKIKNLKINPLSAFNRKPTNQDVLQHYFYLRSEFDKNNSIMFVCKNLQTYYETNFRKSSVYSTVRNRFIKLFKEFNNAEKSSYKSNLPSTINAFLNNLDQVFEFPLHKISKTEEMEYNDDGFDYSMQTYNDNVSNLEEERLVEENLERSLNEDHQNDLYYDKELDQIEIEDNIDNLNDYDLDNDITGKEVLDCTMELIKDPDYQLDSEKIQNAKLILKKKIRIISEDLCSTLDRIKISNRNAFRLIAIVLKELNIDLKDVEISKSNLSKKRIIFRKKIYEKLKKNITFPDILTLHWDGVRLYDNNLKTRIEHLTVKVTGTLNNTKFDQLLNIIRCDSGKADLISNILLE